MMMMTMVGMMLQLLMISFSYSVNFMCILLQYPVHTGMSTRMEHAQRVTKARTRTTSYSTAVKVAPVVPGHITLVQSTKTIAKVGYHHSCDFLQFSSIVRPFELLLVCGAFSEFEFEFGQMIVFSWMRDNPCHIPMENVNVLIQFISILS